MKKHTKKTTVNDRKLLFGRKNYIFLFVGLAFIILGFILMSGGGSNNPSEWNDAIFNFRRIRLAPMMILLGFIIEIYAILLNPDKS